MSTATSGTSTDSGRDPGKPPGSGPLGTLFARPPTTVGSGPAAKAVSQDLGALVAAHRDLAKAELQETAKAKGTGAGLLFGAAAMGWLGLQGLLITAGFLLALLLPGWAAALIVSVVLLVVTAVLGLLGRKYLQRGGFDVTKQAVTDTVTTLKTSWGGA